MGIAVVFDHQRRSAKKFKPITTMKTLLVFVMALAYTSAVKFTATDAGLSCGSNSMKLTLDKDQVMAHERPYRLHFQGATDPACTIMSSDVVDGILAITSDFNACGIYLGFDGGKISYKQTIMITYGKTPDSVVQREEFVYFPVSCNVDSAAETRLAGAGHVNVSKIDEQTIKKSESSEFDIKLVRTTDNTFANEDSSSQMRLGDQMYFKLELNTIRDDLKISPQTCYATNTGETGAKKYYLVENGCPNAADGTVKVTDSPDKTVYEWENEAFRFFGDNDAVYITCEVTVCESSNAASECNRCEAKDRRRRAISNSRIFHSKAYSRIFTLV